MSLILDTSILIAIEKRDKIVLDKLNEINKVENIPPKISFISYYEFLKGLKIRKPKKYNELLEFINKFFVLQTTKKTAEILSDLKIKYDSLGLSLPLADLLIASQSLENHLTLITRDKDFEKITEINKIII